MERGFKLNTRFDSSQQELAQERQPSTRGSVRKACANPWGSIETPADRSLAHPQAWSRPSALSSQETLPARQRYREDGSGLHMRV